MPNDDRMTIDERLKYLRIRQKSYQKASRKEKGELLDEMRSVTCLHRKHLIHLLKAPLVRRPRRKQRGCTYGPEMDDALRVISKSYNVCAELQTPGLAQRASHLASLGRLKVNPDLMEQLRRISPSTVRRIYQDSPSLPHKSPTTPNEVTRCIPMRRIPWDEKAPGHLEVDLVSHSGPSASGEFAHTLQMVDVATAWSERVALLGRSALVTLDALQHALNRLPFHPLQFHFDNGSKFMNHLLIPFLRENLKGIKISRSRPYRKNDNRFVEQKNNTLVRAYLGYGRFDTAAQVNTINQLYEMLWLYDNFFRPAVRLKEKILIPTQDGQPSRIKRIHDTARTPFSRLCSTNAISQDRKLELQTMCDRTDPINLLEETCELIDHICSLPNAVPGKTEDVFQTLYSPLTSRKERAVR